ncbi:hypothetical protein Dsin_016081 [Dipteronia sinensis]|uniref:UBN2_3 domain-containing protein n=1 Tax=Dipteronia sinensis TaxID=43782 RepID=A0AAE0ADS9_9ROSI|nr:hypothetical protein Dsin_016081 [Dipteronia sinensis]
MEILVLPILQNSDLYSILDGSDPCPPKTLPDDLPNPAFQTWVTRDRTCKIWLHAALSDSVLPYTVGCATAKILWKGSNSMMQYLEQMKSIADGLAAAGAPLDDLDLIAHTLRVYHQNLTHWNLNSTFALNQSIQKLSMVF